MANITIEKSLVRPMLKALADADQALAKRHYVEEMRDALSVPSKCLFSYFNSSLSDAWDKFRAEIYAACLTQHPDEAIEELWDSVKETVSFIDLSIREKYGLTEDVVKSLIRKAKEKVVHYDT